MFFELIEMRPFRKCAANFAGVFARLSLALLLPALLSMAGCGGGGGRSTPIPAGDIEGRVDVTASGRQASAVAGAAVTLILPSGKVQRETTSDADGYFSFANVPHGRYFVEAEKDDAKYAMLIDLAGARERKNITPRTTAAVMIYRELEKNGENPSETIDNLGDFESSPILDDLEMEIKTSAAAGTYSYSETASGAAAQAAIKRIEDGAVPTDNKKPVVEIVFPDEGDEFTDADMLFSDAFYLEWSYEDDSPVDFDALSVTLQIDGYDDIDLSGAFKAPTSGSAKFTLTATESLRMAIDEIFEFSANDTLRNAVFSLDISDLAGNRSQTAQKSFTIVPVAIDN